MSASFFSCFLEILWNKICCLQSVSFRTGLFYNASAHTNDTSGTSAVRHEWDRSNTIATQAKKFDLDNKTIEDIFSHACISYVANERLQRQEQLHSKNYLLEASFQSQNSF